MKVPYLFVFQDTHHSLFNPLLSNVDKFHSEPTN